MTAMTLPLSAALRGLAGGGGNRRRIMPWAGLGLADDGVHAARCEQQPKRLVHQLLQLQALI